jgi:protein-S-isoprenylcysteine O-methyltransferase Ste14
MHDDGDRVAPYLRWAGRAHGEPARIRLVVSLGPVFLGALPVIAGGLGPRLDRRLGLASLPCRSACRIAGGVLAVAGFALGLWTVRTQLDRGHGTPLPVMPTQALLTDGPYRHSRNPMTLGAIAAYLGVAVAARSPAGIGLVLAFGAALAAYLKGFEEPELAARFGEPYRRYRRETPFLLPFPAGPVRRRS